MLPYLHHHQARSAVLAAQKVVHQRHDGLRCSTSPTLDESGLDWSCVNQHTEESEAIIVAKEIGKPEGILIATNMGRRCVSNRSVALYGRCNTAMAVNFYSNFGSVKRPSRCAFPHSKK